MELAKELIAEVLRDRTKQFSSGDNAKFGLALANADRFLAEGAAVSIHLMMAHANCKASAKEFCEATQTLEVWTFKLQREVPYEVSARPPMLPLFLRQAVRSQLHFSPFRSWLTARQRAGPSDGFLPLLRVCAASDSAAPPFSSDRLQSHQFPPCLVRSSLPVINVPLRNVQLNSAGEPFWLRVHVQWLKKECFLTKAPLCPEMSMEQQDGLWPLSSTDRCQSRANCNAIGENGGLVALSGEETDESQCTTPTEILSPIVRRKTTESKEGTKIREEKRAVEGTQGNVKVTDGIMLEKRGTQRATERQNDDERETDNRAPLDSPRSQSQHCTDVLIPTSNPIFAPCARPFFHNKMPILRPNKRNGPSLDELHLADGIGAECFADGTHGERSCTSRHQIPSVSMEKSNLSSNKNTWRTPSRLICNFEESILNGRIPANSVVSGFRLQLTVIGNGVSTDNRLSFPASKRLTLPVLTYFFNDLMSQHLGRFPVAVPPSPLHLARCELAAETVPIPKRCTLQIVLLRPCGSVVKLFMVAVNVLDMPSNSRTFIRQRVFSGDSAKETGEKERSGNENKTGGSTNVPNTKPCSNSLRFLIHLRLASDSSGKVYLHSDIRILFSNKSNDLEGLESIVEKSTNSVCSSNVFDTENLREMAQMPLTPKYSPIK
ncbi:hypothetical protein niasHS_003582 [Heterodera schachtii]|uniref:Atos-like conserved domain-containing protein n=1 Tax=Heterodera schachtii TaxID=97005 RepID=A0ABD2KHE7_HETSC